MEDVAAPLQTALERTQHMKHTATTPGRRLGHALGLGAMAPARQARTALAMLLACAAALGHAQPPAPAELRLQDWLQRLRQDNAEVQSARLARVIEQTAVARAQSAFQPTVKWSARNASEAQANTFEQQLARSDLPDYWRKGTDVEAAVSGLLPSGAQWEAKAGVSRFDTNIDQLEPERPLGAKENRATWSLQLTQPLLRDGGTQITRARTQVAELDADAALAREQRSTVTALTQGVTAYYDLALAQGQHESAQAKLDTAQALLTQAQSLEAKGLIAPSAVWEVRNAVDRYRAELSEQRQAWLEASNQLKSMVGLSVRDDPRPWVAADALPAVAAPEEGEADAIVTQALAQRGDLRALRLAEQREQVQLMYARNQAQPRVDLVAQYGRNKLAWSGRDALSGMQTPSWRLGVEVEMPLGRSQRGEADVAAAVARLEQSQWRSRALQAQVINEVDSALALKRSAASRHQQWALILEREQQALSVEQERLRLGRASVREVLNRQEQVLNAQQRQLQQRIAFAQADALLAAAQGRLLDAAGSGP